MPKTVPKSSNQDDLVVSRPVGGSDDGDGNGPVPKQLKRSRRELEPNEDDDDSSSGEPSRKQPNRTDSNQRVAPLPTQDTYQSPPASPARSDFLLQALQRIQELQDEIEFLENDPYAEDADTTSEEENADASFYDGQGGSASAVMGHQAEALGFAVCVRETMAFLEREGIPPDSPMMVNLRSRLVGSRYEQNMSC